MQVIAGRVVLVVMMTMVVVMVVMIRAAAQRGREGAALAP
jgi:hypothetical protein